MGLLRTERHTEVVGKHARECRICGAVTPHTLTKFIRREMLLFLPFSTRERDLDVCDKCGFKLDSGTGVGQAAVAVEEAAVATEDVRAD